GLKRLRELVGEPSGRIEKRVKSTFEARPSEVPAGVKVRHVVTKFDPDRERMRLSSAMKQAGLTTFNRSTGRAVFEEVLECRRAWWLGDAADGCHDRRTFSCHDPNCPSCMPAFLWTDFNHHRADLPDR